jgi:hypothetical protein
MKKPGGRLGHGLEHEYAGEDGKRWKMIGKILLGKGDIFKRHQPVVGHLFDPVDQIEFHQSGPLEQGFSDGVGGLQGRRDEGIAHYGCATQKTAREGSLY